MGIGAEARDESTSSPPSRFGRSVTKRFRSRLPSEVLRLWAPRESRVVLSGMRVFAGCDRRQLARISRWGDAVEVAAGEVLVREDFTDYWFFVILHGAARVSRRRRDLATLQRGDHFGELAIIGFRPQPATVTAAEPTVLFVLGRQQLLSLVALDASIQHALFPEVDLDAFTEFRRRLQQEGRKSWDLLVPRQQRLLADQPLRSTRARTMKAPMPRPGRAMSWDQALEALSHLDRRPDASHPAPEQPASLWTKLIPSAVLAVVLAGLLLFFHPPLAVVTAGAPVDVVRDISITGTRIDTPTGRYLMTTVDVARPNVAGLVYSWALRRNIVHTETRGFDVETERRLGREAFVNSHRQAIALAKRELTTDASGVTIAIRDRGITGPSAGLVYALAILDMLDPDDLADGRTIAATGELRPDESVGRVAFVGLKADAAQVGGATLFLVPASQRAEARRDGLTILGVTNLKDAMRALEAKH